MNNLTIKTPSKKINSKNKGSGFELTIAKLFSKEFAPLCFKRTQMSGAVVGGKNVFQTKTYSDEMLGAFVGDIFVANEADVKRSENWSFRFTIECKFYKTSDTFSALFKNPKVTTWFEQAYADSLKVKNKLPLLVFKFNHTPVFVAFEKSCTPPDNISTLMSMKYNVLDDNKNIVGQREIYIAQLSELLSTKSWWKTNS